MDFSSAIPTFVITLREGVEAALVVGIVMAYLKKVKRSHLNTWVYGGIGGGLLISALVGFLFNAIMQTFGSSNPQVSPVFEPLLEGTFSLVAIAMLSWMLIWMTQQGKVMKGQIEGSLGEVLSDERKAGWGILGLILFAILREGFEVVVFLAAKFQEGLIPAIGILAGLATAVAIAVALFKFGVRINIRYFFQVMGVLLLLIVSGLVISALSHFDTAIHILSQADRKSESLCFFYEHFAKSTDKSCVLGPMVWNATKVLPRDKFPGIILSSLFGYTDRLFLVQAIAYVVFLISSSILYFQSLSGTVFFAKPKNGMNRSDSSTLN
jgi:high-affinity iron transporter